MTEIYFHLVTSPRFFRLDFGSSSFSLNRQDAISPTMGVELCKAALAAAWFGQGFRCINKVPKTSTQKTKTTKVLERKSAQKIMDVYKWYCTVDEFRNPDIKSLLKGCFFFFKSQLKNWNNFQKIRHGFLNHPTGMGIWTNGSWPTPRSLSDSLDSPNSKWATYQLWISK